MPVQIDQSNFTDAFGNVTPFYVSNVGDEIDVKLQLRSIIRMSSIGNPLTLDPSINTVTSPTSWIDEGFRVNDWVYIVRYASGGTALGDWWSYITFVDDTVCDFTAMPEWANLQNQEFMTFTVVDGNGSFTPVARQDMEVQINHIKNSLTFGEFSLIDGEATRVLLQGLGTMIVGQTVNGVIVGNQSGQFLKSAEITRIGDVQNWFAHDLKLTFINSGAYDVTWFQSSECLKLFIRSLWARFTGEPLARAEVIYNGNANTGFFNEAHNSSVTDAEIVQGISELDYCVPTTATIIIDGPLLSIGMGGMYISTDDNYYQNQVPSQTSLTMAIPTTIINTFFVPVSSEQNPSGAGYDIELISFTQIGSISTIEITFTPNTAFSTFMDGVDDGDRLFYLWIKCGNLNLAVFEGQLSCDPPVGGALPMITDYGYLDHSQNYDTINGIKTGFDADTEDDIAYTGTFLLTKNEIYETFSSKIEAFDTATSDDFTLQLATFSFNGVPISSDGRYLLDESQTIITTLPNTSVKLEAKLTLEPALDTPTEYGVRIYYPFLCRWEYWLNLNGVNVDFYPNFDKNWEQYDNIGTWQVRTELQLIKDGLAYVHDNTLIINPYDNEPIINSAIELEQIVSPFQIVNTVIIGQTFILRGTHELANPLNSWNQANVWGMVTVEPFQSSRRWICSTVLETDGNTSNPLTPITGLFASLTFPNQYTAIIECHFNSDLIDLSNGVKFTSKIKENDTAIAQIFKTTSPSDIQKTDTLTDDKTLA